MPGAKRLAAIGRKRLALDLPLAAISLLVLAPVLLCLAVVIRLSGPGPIMFRQQRVGLNGRRFDILKFRSMRAGRTAGPTSVTGIGRILRATSLDELPQLWNVLVGDMSVIGPRPMIEGQLAAGANYRDAVPYYDFRHLVRPGLSGWAQANGLRGPTTDLDSARRRIDHDCAYVQNVSLGLDLRIIAMTIRHEFLTGTGR